MADADPRRRYLDNLKRLQKEHFEARRANDFELAEKKREQIRRIAAEPFDRYIDRIDQENLPEEAAEEGVGNVANPQFSEDTTAAKKEVLEAPGEKEAESLQERALKENLPPPREPYREPVPGGPAREAVKQPAKTPIPEGQTTPKGAVGSVVDKGKQAGKQLADQAIKAVKKAAAQALKKLAVTFFSSPWGWAIIGSIVGLIILLILVAIFWGSIMNMFHKVSTTGTTFTQAADPLKDKEWIQKLLLLAGDSTASQKINEEFLNGLTNDVSNIEKDFQLDDSGKNLIQSINETITALGNPNVENKEELAAKLITDMTALVNKLRNNMPVYPGATQSILPGVEVTGGNTPHGLSFMVRESSPKQHNVVYESFGQVGLCDAVDMILPGDKQGTHPNAFPIFAGKVIAKRNLVGQTAQVLVVEDSNGYKALYTDIIDSAPNVGDNVSLDSPIGKVMNRLIHVQVSYKDICLVTTPADYYDWKKNGGPYGKYLLSHVKEVFKLN